MPSIVSIAAEEYGSSFKMTIIFVIVRSLDMKLSKDLPKSALESASFGMKNVFEPFSCVRNWLVMPSPSDTSPSPLPL
ncbi:hypothetical protein D3C71_2191280 [compost metagenome]